MFDREGLGLAREVYAYEIDDGWMEARWWRLLAMSEGAESVDSIVVIPCRNTFPKVVGSKPQCVVLEDAELKLRR